MRVVLDEGVPEDLVGPLRRLGAAVDPIPNEWRGLRNGVLLAAVEQAGYSILLTNDKNVAFQVSLRQLRIAIVALPLNRRRVLLGRLPDILDTILSARLGQAISIGMDGRRVVRSAGPSGAVSIGELAPVQAFR